ncbi:hypothetical protein CRG98_041134 [Punica granatum]|uniref:Uncharacterized protein n=1 Tax=Punica granatum TaxID=22663 RepID=A0A2I0I365_PUNGR|nr:hypothetical protein CRG98_041134 [Punica granatum]
MDTNCNYPVLLPSASSNDSNFASHNLSSASTTTPCNESNASDASNDVAWGRGWAEGVPPPPIRPLSLSSIMEIVKPLHGATVEAEEWQGDSEVGSSTEANVIQIRSGANPAVHYPRE